MGERLKRQWGWVDWFVLVLRFLWFILTIVLILHNGHIEQLGFILSWALLSYAIPQLFYLPGNVKPSLFVWSEIIFNWSFHILLMQQVPDAVNHFAISMFIIAFLAPKKSLVFLAPIIFIVFPVVVTQLVKQYSIGDILLNSTLFFALGYCFKVFFDQKSRLTMLVKSIEEKNKLLEQYNHQVEQVTLLEERSRMGRELHDTVGHSLTASIVGMEAVQALIKVDPTQAEQRLKDLILYSRNTLDGFRENVHAMSMNELKLPLHDILQNVIQDFADQTGTEIEMEVQVVPKNTPESIKLALLRCLQEALTNAKKHGDASYIKVTLTWKDDLIQMIIQDNGLGTDEMVTGFGIENMRERIEGIRGSLHVTSKKEAGTTVRCELPIGSVTYGTH
jgi:signal transduction histidine kinase